jgi:large subunit ribosomal protein LP2
MKYVAAYALLALNKEEVTAQDLTNLLTSMGTEVQQSAVDHLVNSLKGMPISEAINQGMSKISSMNIGGGANNNVVVQGEDDDVKSEVSEEEADVSMGDLFGSD